MKFEYQIEHRNKYSYVEYRNTIDSLLNLNKTTGNDHSDAMLAYTKMNVTRMNRWDKKASINADLAQIIQKLAPQKWLIISEAWCGDAAQNIPLINKMAELNPLIELQIVLRDENLDLIDAYLTNNGRSIPKIIAIDQNNEVLFSWGPRPKHIQETYNRLKIKGESYSEISKTIHTMYAADKGITIQAEFKTLMK